MNKSESKYFHTAERMDKSFLELLSQKDFAYITVKEICERAGVNRSTFYLHYETMGDLLSESMDYMNRQFKSHFDPDSQEIVRNLKDCPSEELYLITPKYLTPYLNFIRENRRLFRTAVENAGALRLGDTYDRMFAHVFSPILERFRVPESDRQYIMSFYIHGLMAIITEWLERDCADSIDHVIAVIHQCILLP
ncbi:MAG: TetR/AcrR family transcriptional regulator [Eubacteriales bacterium]